MTDGRSSSSAPGEEAPAPKTLLGNMPGGMQPAHRIRQYVIESLVFGLLAFFTLGLCGLPGLWFGCRALFLAALSGIPLRRIGGAWIAISLSLVAIGFWGCTIGHLFWSAREKASEITCESQLKDLGQGLLMYAEDYNDHLPFQSDWMDQVERYRKVTLTCPEAPSQEYGYSYNTLLSGLDQNKIPYPSETVSVFDSKASWRNSSGGANLLDPRHLGMAIAAFTDGHARSMRPGSFGCWNPTGESEKPGR